MQSNQKIQTLDPLKRLLYLLCRIAVFIFTRTQYLIIFMLPLLPFLLIFTAVTTNSELDKMFQVQEDGTMSGSVEGPFFFITFFSTIAFAIFVLKSKLTTALFVSSLLFLLAAIGALFGSFDESTSRPTMMLLSVFGLFLYAFSLLILYGADWMLGKLRNVLGLKN